MNPPIVDFVPTADPLLRRPQLAYVVELPILGLATRFESNSRFVQDVVEESFGAWRARAAEAQTSEHPLRITVVVHDDAERSDPPSPVRHISTEDGRLIVHSPGSVAIVDPSRRESLAYVTTALVADRGHFRVAVLEAITFALVAGFDRHPVHAAALARDGRALLLAARSGTGKSTIAYMAHRAGIGVLSDDHVWVQLQPALRIWSGSPQAWLLAEASAHFPELSEPSDVAHEEAASSPSTRPQRKVRVMLPAAGEAVPCLSATVCVMERGTSVALERVDGSQLRQALATQLAPGFDRFSARHEFVMGALTAEGGWRLTLSDNPFDALPLLQRMLDAR